MNDFTHIIAYDNSGSTSSCSITEVIDGETRKISYFNYIQNFLLRSITEQNPYTNFIFIAWNSSAKITSGIVENSTGGTDPSALFDLIEKQFISRKLYVHFITDGDIYGCNYDKLRPFISENPTELRFKLDIYYVGNNNHNIEFYQKVKEQLQESCNVYVNKELIRTLTEIVDGQFFLTDQEQLEILSHDYGNTEIDCPPAFNKLMGTISTYSSSATYKEIIRKTLGSLIRQSRGSLGNQTVDDDIPMDQLRNVLTTHKKAVNVKFDAVITYIIKKVDSGRFLSGELTGKYFLKNLSKDREFDRIQAEFIQKQNLSGDKDVETEMEVDFDNDNSNQNAGSKDKLICAIALEEITDVYILEASFTGMAFKNDISSHIDKIRQFPWSMFNTLSAQKFSELMNVIVTPYKVENFFRLNENRITSNQLFASLYNFTSTSFVLLHKDVTLKPSDLQIILNLNFLFASNVFFNKRPGDTQTHVGKKFEIVYIYLVYLLHYFKMKKSNPIFIEDVEYTLDILAKDPRSLCKIPQFSIYFSLKLFKRILTESRMIEPISTPMNIMMIRKHLNITSIIQSDSILVFIGCLIWLNTGARPKEFLENDLLDEKIFKEIMGIDAPTKASKIKDIFRLLLTQFIRAEYYKDLFLFVNEGIPEKELYYNGIPLNFMKFLLISLNHPNLKLNSKVSNENHRNIDMSLFNAYSPNYVYKVKFDNILYKIRLSDNPVVKVCWSTMRPKTFYPDNKIWTDFCTDLDKTKPHKDRLKECDSLHISLFKHFQLIFCEKERVYDLDEFLKYLSEKFEFKTFEPNVIEDARDVVNIYTEIFNYYNNDPKVIKKRIRLMLDLEKRKKFEDDCQIPQCFHTSAI